MHARVLDRTLGGVAADFDMSGGIVPFSYLERINLDLDFPVWEAANRPGYASDRRICLCGKTFIPRS
jgi:hypothetical protein